MARHPLQRLEAPGTLTSTIVHATGVISFSLSFWYLWSVPNPMDEMDQNFGAGFQFLTIIGLAAAWLTFVSGFLADVTLSPELFHVKNVLSVCATPLEVLISTLYWGICAIDKNLVFPPELQLPFLPDFGFHAAPTLLLTLDLLLMSPPWTIRGYHAMAQSLILALLYWAWVEYCFTKNGWYPYPIFGMLCTWERMLLFSFSSLLMAGSTMVLKWVYGKLNGLEEIKKEAFKPLKGE